jgi:hypothetical protein
MYTHTSYIYIIRLHARVFWLECLVAASDGILLPRQNAKIGRLASKFSWQKQCFAIRSNVPEERSKHTTHNKLISSAPCSCFLKKGKKKKKN